MCRKHFWEASARAARPTPSHAVPDMTANSGAVQQGSCLGMWQSLAAAAPSQPPGLLLPQCRSGRLWGPASLLRVADTPTCPAHGRLSAHVCIVNIGGFVFAIHRTSRPETRPVPVHDLITFSKGNVTRLKGAIIKNKLFFSVYLTTVKLPVWWMLYLILIPTELISLPVLRIFMSWSAFGKKNSHGQSDDCCVPTLS